MNVSHVEIFGGVSNGAFVSTDKGLRTDDRLKGKYVFFVDIVEQDGGRICMWDGLDHQAARLEAGKLAADLGCDMRDTTVGRAA